jgi:hypothetical protein
MTVNPVVCHPVSARMRGTIPMARRPNVVVALVAVIAVDPNVSTIRRRRPAFNNGRRWSDADDNLRK